MFICSKGKLRHLPRTADKGEGGHFILCVSCQMLQRKVIETAELEVFANHVHVLQCVLQYIANRGSDACLYTEI